MKNISFIFFVIIFIFFTRSLCIQLGCDPVTSLCNCLPYQIYRNGQCNTCLISHCKLCSFQNYFQCDICQTNYVLDSLTKSSCHPKILNNSNECQPLQNLCPPFEISKNGECRKCIVQNCLLCSSQSQYECDICQKDFVLDRLTKSACLMPNNSLVCSQRKQDLCSCKPFQLRMNEKCISCSAPNCLLCSLDNQNECDACRQGYILDSLTKGQCIKIQDQTKLECNQIKPKCSAFEKYQKGKCQKCLVNNCKLCSYQNFQMCDVCEQSYLLNKVTLKCDAPICEQKRLWNGNQCVCDLSLKLVEVSGVCRQMNQESQLALLVGLGFPLVVITIGVIFSLKLKKENEDQLIKREQWAEDEALEGGQTEGAIKVEIENIERIK